MGRSKMVKRTANLLVGLLMLFGIAAACDSGEAANTAPTPTASSTGQLTGALALVMQEGVQKMGYTPFGTPKYDGEVTEIPTRITGCSSSSAVVELEIGRDARRQLTTPVVDEINGKELDEVAPGVDGTGMHADVLRRQVPATTLKCGTTPTPTGTKPFATATSRTPTARP